MNMVGPRPNAYKPLPDDRAHYRHSNLTIPVFVKRSDDFYGCFSEILKSFIFALTSSPNALKSLSDTQ